MAAVAIGGGGGDEPAKKDKPPEAAPAADDASTIEMTEAKMASDPDGEQPTTVFSPSDTFYCVGNLENAPDNTKVTAVWIASDVEDIKPDSTITKYSARGGSGLFRFQLSPNDKWPPGEYEVELYLNDAKEPTRALQFEVR